ncbi:MAG TPA: N-acetylmuramic acid 6-phosphate etherase [Bacillota bacterium]|nr:N-acetylmuramic acid 6-phosphate etherase [Bacillota bacterium]
MANRKYIDDQPITESCDVQAPDLSVLDSLGIVSAINAADASVAPAVSMAMADIARTVDLIVDRLQHGGRLFYMGAGTSGRLGVLDASECPPTFGTAPDLVVGMIAGGDRALKNAVEGAEDDLFSGERDLSENSFSASDVLVAISASGSTPYVLGAVSYARSLGAATVGVSCNPGSALTAAVDIAIVVVVGPELLTGSTRMKAGTAQKMVLNMISTATMIRLGKTYKNRMVDLAASNKKLRQRAIRLVTELADVPQDQAEAALARSDWSVRVALVMLILQVDQTTARRVLAERGNILADMLSGV